jgi:hypothetical protein
VIAEKRIKSRKHIQINKKLGIFSAILIILILAGILALKFLKVIKK